MRRARCRHGRAFTGFVAGAARLRDGEPVAVPVRPSSIFA